MKKYTHLNSKRDALESDWNTHFFRKKHTPSAFENNLTSNIVLTVEKMFSLATAQIKSITNYRKF
ncbi:hypothetical protein HYO65_gp174 [Tenacibaculum phage PTm1]|uniref:Uncharacterized protein n=2 Tax=Shirahamavirus PTm1 TaxID=2846435 RepID=A0A5S9HXT8_9CAUD|nr:hypothetical protein HYO65_gp174 [Tenacibaculum phage PTm1]BBI90566.1 hypothetical protein [Tenacibaculum phage PTm1]BBI90874.1 hypothetical protein [Tenacibaculum phage PTm5]